MTVALSDRDWDIRLHIYRAIVDDGRAPTVEETARVFGITVEETREAYHRLHRPHHIVLEPGTETVRMAIPLSAIPTAHRVWVGDRCLFANCAWDSLGVAAMLDADARIDSPSGNAGACIRYAIQNGSLVASSDLCIHFPLPLNRWFDDIVNT